MQLRIGNGIDYHRLEPGRDFWIGGVLVPHHQGAVGHSDADVLLHAICDALLGALALGDIGAHFPDTDDQYKGIDSKILLQHCFSLIREKGFQVNNIDSTVCLQAPKLRPYIDNMREVIARILEIPSDVVAIKATTAEKMGFVGREEGVMAYATALLIRNEAQ